MFSNGLFSEPAQAESATLDSDPVKLTHLNQKQAPLARARDAIRRVYKAEDGATAVLTAVIFTALVMMTGIVIDLGRLHIETSRLQTAADAAAYAAAAVLPVAEDDSAKYLEAVNLAETYAAKNAAGASIHNAISVNLGESVAGTYTSVSVELSSEVDYLFGKILGLESKTVSKRATASLGVIDKASQMVPLGITSDNLINTIAYNGAQNVVIKYGAGDGDTGFYGALDLDGVKGGGANDYEQWLNYGYYGYIETGDLLYTEPGNMDGPTQTAFTDRFNSCTHFSGQGGCTAEHFDPDCPRVIYIIVYDQLSKDTVEVRGFAPFILTGINDNSEIVASLVNVQMKSGEISTPDAETINYGMFAVMLTE